MTLAERRVLLSFFGRVEVVGMPHCGWYEAARCDMKLIWIISYRVPLGTLKERWKRSPLLFGGYTGAFLCVVDAFSNAVSICGRCGVE